MNNKNNHNNKSIQYKKRRILPMVDIRIAVLLLVGFLAIPLIAGELSDNFIKTSGLNSDNVGILIIDLSSGDTIENHNAEKALIPASITKAVTIASLTHKIDFDYTFKTNVYTCGKIKEGVLQGDLLIVGSGDPTINSSAAPKSNDFTVEICDALKKKNITCIEGRIIVNQDIFPGPAQPSTWATGDLKHSYGTGCYGFNFRNNSSGKSSVSNPAGIFETALKNELAKVGISVLGENLEEGARKLLLTHRSATIDEIMRSCMMRSDNLYAEALLRLFGLNSGLNGSTSAAAEEEMKFWQHKKMPMENVNIVDGSGLSRSNRITPQFMAQILSSMSDDATYASFFPLAGAEGTLRRFLAGTPLDSYIAMKTGSMSGIQCYAGYKLDDDYAPTHVVVVMLNNMSTSRDVVRNALADMLLKIFPEN